MLVSSKIYALLYIGKVTMKKQSLLFLILITHFLIITLYAFEKKSQVPSLVTLASDKIAQEYASQKHGFKQLREKGLPFRLSILVANKINSIETLIDQDYEFKVKKGSLSAKKRKLESLYGLDKITEKVDSKTIIKIDFSHKTISCISIHSFNPFGALQSLDLSHNKIKNLFGITFKGCSTLQSLNLSHNLIHQIPANLLTGLIALQSINLSHNQIQEFSKRLFKDLPRLQSVNLSHNKIERLQPDSLTGLPALQYAHLAANQLKSVPKSCFTGTPQLKSIHLHGNNIHNQNIPPHIKDKVKK